MSKMQSKRPCRSRLRRKIGKKRKKRREKEIFRLKKTFELKMRYRMNPTFLKERLRTVITIRYQLLEVALADSQTMKQAPQGQ